MHGAGGYDEATTTGTNKVAFLRSGKVSTFTVEPEDMGFARVQPDALRGGSPKENVAVTRRILDGEGGPCTDTVLLNSGLALLAADRIKDLPDGIALARESIQSGNAAKVLEKLIETTQSLAEKP